MALIDQQRFRGPGAAQFQLPSQQAFGFPQQGGLAGGVARARLDEFLPPGFAGGGGGGAAPSFAPSLGGQQLGGFQGLVGVPQTGTAGTLLEAGDQQLQDVVSQRQASASVFGSILDFLARGQENRQQRREERRDLGSPR